MQCTRQIRTIQHQNRSHLWDVVSKAEREGVDLLRAIEAYLDQTSEEGRGERHHIISTLQISTFIYHA